MINFDILQNFDLLSVGMAIAAIGILGFVVYFNNHRSVTSRSFLWFAVVTIFWSAANYLQYKTTDPTTSFWMLRLVVFFGMWYAFSIFRLFTVFPEEKFDFPKSYTRLLLPVISIVSILSLTPLVFESISEIDFSGHLVGVNNGPAIVLYAFMVLGLIIASFYNLFKKTIMARGQERRGFLYLLFGVLVTFILMLVFNFILPAFFGIIDYIPLGPVFVLPFAVFTFYAISRHNLFAVKVISTEIVAFFLVIAAFSQILLSKSVGETVFQVSVFVLLLLFSILLIRSVMREVRQREELEKLTKELEAANAELKKLDQLKSDFLSFATHQLRSPLTVTKGYISMIVEGSYGQADEKIIERLKRVYESNEHLIKLVDDFLNLSRIEQGRIKYDFSLASVEDIAGEVAVELGDAARKKGLELLWQKPALLLPQTVLDASKIHEVIYNLVDNAIKYTQNGKVEIKTEKAGHFLRICVRDTGIGLEANDAKDLSQKFNRAGQGYKVNVQGHGIGLYVARQMVEAHGGRIWVESPGSYRGSTFCVEMPIK